MVDLKADHIPRSSSPIPPSSRIRSFLTTLSSFTRLSPMTGSEEEEPPKRTKKPSRKTLPQLSDDEPPKKKKSSTNAAGKPSKQKSTTAASSSSKPSKPSKSSAVSKPTQAASNKKNPKGKQKEVEAEPEAEDPTPSIIDVDAADADEANFVEDEDRLKRREAKVLLSKQKVQAAQKISAEITTQGLAKGFSVPTEWIDDNLELKSDLDILGA